jgi:hypothetical protein
MTNVASRTSPEEPDATSYALRGWGRTARLRAIRLSEALPSFASLVVWLILRR